MAEHSGVPSVTIAIQGFTAAVKAIGKNAGLPNLPVVTYPGVISTHSKDQIIRNFEDVLVDQIIDGLLRHEPPAEAVSAPVQPEDREIVLDGDFEEINEHFLREKWSDGLPVVPPTIQKVEAFLRYTDRSPDESLGTLDPSKFAATVWKVAVNGVMAGCRPEYMPVLLAIVEVMASPQFGLKHAGATPGWEALIMLNGPITRQLGFNYKGGVQRPGNQANTSIGRFFRLFSRNVAGYLPGLTDMATFGHMFRAVVPENEEACREIGWKPLHVARGFEPEDSVITITSARAISDPFLTAGDNAERHLGYIVDWAKRMIEPYQSSRGYVESHVLLMSPSIAATLAKDGYSKSDVNDYIKKHAVVPAHYFEWSMTQGLSHPRGTTLVDLVKKGAMPPEWGASEDPDRLVPLFLPSTQWLVMVTGDPTRNRNCIYRQNFNQGYATSRKINLPADWESRLAGLKKHEPA